MILTGTVVRRAIIDAIKAPIAPIPVYSIMPPNPAPLYVIIENLTENEINEKQAFLTEGFISISCIEKFTGRDGDFDQVTALANQIANILTPTRQAGFGITDGIDIFTMQIDAVTDGMFESDPGRNAVVSLRLNYKAQTT